MPRTILFADSASMSCGSSLFSPARHLSFHLRVISLFEGIVRKVKVVRETVVIAWGVCVAVQIESRPAVKLRAGEGGCRAGGGGGGQGAGGIGAITSHAPTPPHVSSYHSGREGRSGGGGHGHGPSQSLTACPEIRFGVVYLR